MKARSGVLVAVFALAMMPGCGGSHKAPATRPVWVAPRIDLKPHEMIGIVEFSSTSRGSLGPLATRRFTESARRDQGLVRIMEVRPAAAAARATAPGGPDPEALRALGREHGLKTIVTGNLTVSSVRPVVQMSALLRSGHVSAQVSATLEVRMTEASTGASLWNGSGSATRTLGNVAVFGGREFAFDADDPDRAYGELVDVLVEQVTRDFRATWERR